MYLCSVCNDTYGDIELAMGCCKDGVHKDSKYYYEFLVSNGVGSEHYYRHYEKEGLNEDQINELEEKLVDDLESITCFYVGEGYEVR